MIKISIKVYQKGKGEGIVNRRKWKGGTLLRIGGSIIYIDH
ncbi:hypothetical protein KSS87_012516 [Heliosperma pusillum]|nr:hypothetical protein KSS87_012516 [Heliosperma pusillum]